MSSNEARPSLAERLAAHPTICFIAEDAGSSPAWLSAWVLKSIADVGGIVHHSNMDSNDGIKP